MVTRDPQRTEETGEPLQIGSFPPLALRKLTGVYLLTGGLYSIPWFSRSLRCIEELTSVHSPVTGRIMAFTCLPVGIVAMQVIFRIVVLPFGYMEGLSHLFRSPAWSSGALLSVALYLVGVREFYRLVHYDLERFRVRVGGLIYVRHPALEAAWFGLLWLCWMLPNPIRYVALLAVFPVRRAQVAMNNYLDVAAHTPEERHFSRWEMVAAILGGAVLLWLIGGALVRIVDIFEPSTIPGYNG